MSQSRTPVIVSLIIAIFILFGIEKLYSTAASPAMELPSPDIALPPAKAPLNPNIPIKITLSAAALPHSQHITTSSSAPSVTIHLRISNTSPSKAVFFLAWSTPISPLAAAQGIFSFVSTGNGHSAPSLSLKPNRRVPPSQSFSSNSEHIIRIEAGGVLERDVIIKAPQVGIVKGERYQVVAEGEWLGVWVDNDGDGGDTNLSLAEGEGVLRGGFESNVLEVEVAGS